MPPEDTDNTATQPVTQEPQPQPVGINPQEVPSAQFPPDNTPQNTEPAPPPKKAFPTKKLLIGLTVLLIIIGLAGAGFFLYQKSTINGAKQNKISASDTSKSSANTVPNNNLIEKIFPKSYSSCFGSYNKKFTPSTIGNYQMADAKISSPIYQDIQTSQLLTTWMTPTRLADIVKVNWALQAEYNRVPPLPQSQNKFLEENLVIISVVNLVESDKYNDQVLSRYNKLTLETIGDIQAAVFSQNGPNNFQYAGSAIITNIPKTNIFISMTFANSENAREFFSNWLKTVCS